MKLNFEVLTEPAIVRSASKTRGQAGTPGTRASMRARAVPDDGDSSGTRGDEGAGAVRHGAFSSAPCPHASLPRPRETAPEKAKEINVSPASPLVPTIASQTAGDAHFNDEAFEERAAIMEFEGSLARADAEAAARALASTEHRMKERI